MSHRPRLPDEVLERDTLHQPTVLLPGVRRPDRSEDQAQGDGELHRSPGGLWHAHVVALCNRRSGGHGLENPKETIRAGGAWTCHLHKPLVQHADSVRM
jgi:hypothetical protein